MAALVVSLLAVAHLFAAASAFDNIASNRREALQRVGLGILGGTAILPQPSHAVAADEEFIDRRLLWLRMLLARPARA